MHIDVHLQSEDVSVYWLWLLVYLCALSVVMVITAICNMPRQEVSLCECVYIQNTYMKSRKSCCGTRCKFRVKFPGGSVPNPSTIRRQTKRFKETGSAKNRKVNRRRHVFTEETLDDISKTFITENWRLYEDQQNYWNYIYVLWIYTRSCNENSCLGMSQITITTLTALMYNNNNYQ